MSDDRPRPTTIPPTCPCPVGRPRPGAGINAARSIEVAVERAHAPQRRFATRSPRWTPVGNSWSRDLDVGGPLITGAVAFRMFLWLLPATLVAVVGFGLFADTTGGSPEGVAKSAGIKGFAAQSIVSATKSSTEGRWLLVAVGIMALLLGDTLPGQGALAEPRARVACAEALFSQDHYLGGGRDLSGSRLLRRLRRRVSGARTVGGLGHRRDRLLLLGWFGLWLLISRLLPHGDAPLTALIPGAVLVALCIEALRVVTIYYIAGKINSSSSVYGGLGTAAVLMTWFYLLARVVVAAAVVNATLWERRQRGASNAPRRRSTASGTP